MNNTDELDWYNTKFMAYLDSNDDDDDLTAEQVNTDYQRNQQIDPSFTNERLIYKSHESTWMPSFLLSTDFEKNLQDFSDLINNKNRIEELEKATILRGSYQESLPFAKLLHSIQSCTLTALEASWTYRYQRRYLWYVAQQCDKLFPFELSHITIKYALSWIQENTHAEDLGGITEYNRNSRMP